MTSDVPPPNTPKQRPKIIPIIIIGPYRTGLRPTTDYPGSSMKPSDQRVAALDLVRGVAGYAVAIPHFLAVSDIFAGVSEAIAIAAVDVFFALSGYVLAYQIMLCVESRSWNVYGRFLVRRWMRTLPSFFVALAGLGAVTGSLSDPEAVLYVFFAQNLFAQHIDNDFFPVAWSLSVEEWFYLTFPLLLFVAIWYMRSTVGAFVAGFLLISLAIKIPALYHAEDIGTDVRRVVVYRLDAIALGFVLYLCRDMVLSLGGVVLTAIACAAALVTALALWLLIAGNDNAGLALVYFYSSGLFACALLAAAVSRERKIGRAAAEWCYRMGRLSYPVYLFHLIFIYAIADRLETWVGLPLYLVMLTAFCFYFNRYFEQPILAARPPLYGRVAPSS